MDLSLSRLQALFPAQEIVKKIPFRLRLILLTTLLVLCWTSWFFKALNQHHKLQTLSTEVNLLCSQAKKLQRQKELHQKMQEQISRADPDYLTQVVEPMSLLEDEKKRAASLAKLFPDNISLKERLLFLNSDQNQIHFEDLRLSHRVQMNASDLRIFLEALEADRYNVMSGKPFLLIKKFDLIKCYEKGDEKVYSIQVEL